MSAVLLPDTDQSEPQEPTMRRRSRATGRARRWDSGPAATARDLAVLLSALFLLGLSVLADLSFSDAYDGIPVLLEDGFKFGGICAWAAYHTKSG